MCGRYTLTHDPEAIPEAFSVTREGPGPLFERSYNIAPMQRAPIVRLREGARVLRVYRWGLIPAWATDPRIASQCINARSETVAVKPAFRVAYRKRRCLVPASGYYEWLHKGKAKIPHYLHPRDGAMMAFAGLWEAWKDPEGKTLRTYTILTGAPNAVASPLHDRMPVILPRTHWDAWLDPATPVEDLHALLGPAPDALLEAYPVDRRVGSPAVNEPSLVARIHAA